MAYSHIFQGHKLSQLLDLFHLHSEHLDYFVWTCSSVFVRSDNLYSCVRFRCIYCLVAAFLYNNNNHPNLCSSFDSQHFCGWKNYATKTTIFMSFSYTFLGAIHMFRALFAHQCILSFAHASCFTPLGNGLSSRNFCGFFRWS